MLSLRIGQNMNILWNNPIQVSIAYFNNLLAVLPQLAPAARIPCCVVSLADRLQGSIKAGSRFENRDLLMHAVKRLPLSAVGTMRPASARLAPTIF